MTDPDLIAKKLAVIETHVRELRTLVDVEKIQVDVNEERFAAHTLQLAIQSALDVCSHIVSDEKLGEPQTNQELFTLLERHGWLSAPLAVNLRNMAGFRNILVHGYQNLNLDILIDALRNRLSNLLEFVDAVRARMGGLIGGDRLPHNRNGLVRELLRYLASLGRIRVTANRLAAFSPEVSKK